MGSGTTTTSRIVGGGAVTIRERRERLGLARTALAARAPCSVTHLQNIEAGVIPQNGNVVPLILKALDDAESISNACNADHEEILSTNKTSPTAATAGSFKTPDAARSDDQAY
jgi:ribosome-binding protein aMBF1 (putative translation factor)